jgi:tetratricopeptide (TPR) repeat protein
MKLHNATAFALLSFTLLLGAQATYLTASATEGDAATTANTTPTVPDATAPATPANSGDSQQMLFKPGQSISVDATTEDITPTYDVPLAEKQVAAYPDSPEASFILAVALTRTSRVEDALKEVQRARKLAEKQGGPNYFDKMIDTYEKMLTNYPDENKVRYELAWAYYMKAYLLSRQSRHVAAWKAANPNLVPLVEAQQKQAAGAAAAATATPTAAVAATNNATSKDTSKDIVKALAGNPAAAATALSQLANGPAGHGQKPALDSIPHIPGALEKVDPPDIPQIKAYFEKALGKLDEILKREPDDIWTIVYGAHLRAEYTGNLEAAMKVWRKQATVHPNNPASYFFLGEGYLKQGNLKESINSVSRAIALRSLGN